MLHRALSGGTVEMWGTGAVTRDFIHVDDVAAAFLAAAAYDGPHRIMNVGTGQGRSLNQVAADLAEVLDLPNLSVVHRSGRAADVPVSVLDTKLIHHETGWLPRVPRDARPGRHRGLDAGSLPAVTASPSPEG